MNPSEAFSDYCKNVVKKLEELGIYTVVLDESDSFIDQEDDYFPRLEVQPIGLNDFNYNSQREIESSIQVAVMGYFKSNEEFTQIENSLFLLQCALQVKGKLFSFNTDKRKGIDVAYGFQMVNADADIAVETKFDQGISSFVVVFGSKFILQDEVEV